MIIIPTAKISDTNSYAVYFKNMLENGVYLVPSQFETMFVSASHTSVDIEKTILANRAALKGVSLSKRVV